ncbi:MAG: FecR domain-containing protein, partial [Deltaproteobacteria bacterium]|nr:FecR domain-containing protein [Deltaproteobacteria bacterium]
MRQRLLWSVCAAFSIYSSLSGLAIAQQQPVGVVTGVQGQAQLSRSTVPTPSPLRFKDGVIIRDIVDTREKSLARILFGGRSTVTVRELSRLEVREEILPTGARRDVHDLSSGAILVNVARQLMRPGDEVIIRTPNAVAAVRGSTIFAQFIRELNQTFLAIIAGSALVTPEGRPPVTLTPNTGLNVIGTGPGVQATQVTVPQSQANQILQESQVGKAATQEANKEQVVQASAKEAANLANAVIEQVTKAEQGGGPPPQEGGDKTGEPQEGQPPPPPKDQDPGGDKSKTVSETGCNSCVKNGSFETTGSIPDWTQEGTAASIITDFGGGTFKPTEGSRMVILHTGSGAFNNVSNEITQSFKPKKGGVYLITFDYNFMTNEISHSSTFNDTFEATLVDGNNKETLILKESRNSSSFKKDKGAISGGGFTLNANEGYTDFKSASKTVTIDTGTADLDFEVFDVGDTVVDSAVLIDNVKVELDPPLYLLTNGETLVGPSQKPLVEVSDQTVTFDSVLVSSGPPPNGTSSVSLSGPLLKAERSNLTVPFSLLGLLDGSTLTTTSSDPLVWLQDGNYSLSHLKGTAIFDFWGTKTALDPDTGVEVGTTSTVQHKGPLLEASAGSTVQTQKVLKLDTALLEATAPIISLIGSPNASTSLTTNQSTIDLIKSKVISTGPVIAMDKSFINVTNGALINLTHGSNMKVTGDLLSLFSGSKINVVNGPLISAAGVGSLLNVSGALVNFGGTG